MKTTQDMYQPTGGPFDKKVFIPKGTAVEVTRNDVTMMTFYTVSIGGKDVVISGRNVGSC